MKCGYVLMLNTTKIIMSSFKKLKNTRIKTMTQAESKHNQFEKQESTSLETQKDYTWTDKTQHTKKTHERIFEGRDW